MNEVTVEIKNRIRALLAKAESSEHEGESSLYMGKATELMEKYQVELFELHVEDPIGMSIGGRYVQGPPAYKSDVHIALAYYYGARTVRKGHSKAWRIEIIGPESSRITTELMLDFVWAQVGQQAKKMHATHPFLSRGTCVRDIAKALSCRIWDLTNNRRPEQAKDGTAFSLVVVDAVEAFIAKEYPDLKKGKDRTITLKPVAREFANEIKINQQFGSKDHLRLG